MSFLSYLDDYEKQTVAPVPVKKQAPITPKPAQQQKAHIVESVSDDEYLSENSWKIRGDKWIDPVTRNILVWEAAYAVQQERDRVGTLMEHVAPQTRVTTEHISKQTPSITQTPKPKFDMTEHASSILDGVEWNPEEASSYVQSVPDYPAVAGEPIAPSYDIDPNSMSIEDRLLYEAQTGGNIGQSYGNPDLVRSNRAGLSMAEMASDIY